MAEAGGLDVDAEVEEDRRGRGRAPARPRPAFFLGEDGRGEVLRATEHLLQRLYGAALQPRALRLTCEGFRERRDQALAEEARRIAAAVRGDGEPRTLAPQNAYERRVVHVALQDEPGVTTYSVGEGPDRRVTVAPRGRRAPAPETRDGRSEHRAALEALGLAGRGGGPARRLPRHPGRLEPADQPDRGPDRRRSGCGSSSPTSSPAAHLPEPGSLIDVGSGNGSPGLVLALVRDDLEVTLLEPRARRWAFLREAARASGARASASCGSATTATGAARRGP